MARERRRLRLAPALAVLAFAGACGAPDASSVPTAVVEEARFESRIRARGELKAERATPIIVPSGLDGVQRIAWIAEEGQAVSEGVTLARLDEERIVRQVQDLEDAIETIDIQIRARRRELERERRSITRQLSLLKTQRRDAERFAPRDRELFTRIEIIEAELDLDLIDTRMAHARERLERYVRRAEAELGIMELQRSTQAQRLSKLNADRASLVMKGPHDGIFLPSRTWQGERMRPGMTVWRGQQLGELPDLSRMQARVFVLESEAAGLAEGARAEVTLDAYPDSQFSGRVVSVQPVAGPIEPESPVKYFETLVSLDVTETALMRPGSRVRAVIVADERDGALAIPNQALFRDEEGTFVHVASDGGFERRAVTLGARSIARTVIETGLTAGENVALVDPAGGRL